MEWISDKIDSALAWFSSAFSAVFTAITTWLKDFAVWVFDALLSGVVSILEAIPVPTFLQNGLTPLFSALPQSLVYLLVETGLLAGLALVGAGVGFYLIRKAATLGQW